MGLLFLPMASPDSPVYDEVADAYGRALDPEGAGLDDPVLTELVGDVDGAEVLSLACGQGQDARLLARLGARVTGIDLSREMLRRAIAHETAQPRGITYAQGDAQELAAFADASFDGVVCHVALIDIPDLAATVRSVARVLRPGGWFAFSIVDPCFGGHVAVVGADYLVEHRYRKPRPPDWLPPHSYHRPVGAYVNELAGAGFRVERLVEAHHPDAMQDGVPALLYARAVSA